MFPFGTFAKILSPEGATQPKDNIIWLNENFYQHIVTHVGGENPENGARMSEDT